MASFLSLLKLFRAAAPRLLPRSLAFNSAETLNKHTQLHTQNTQPPTVALNGVLCFLNCQIKHVTPFEWDRICQLPAKPMENGRGGV